MSKRQSPTASVYDDLDAVMDENRQLRERLRRLTQNVEAAGPGAQQRLMLMLSSDDVGRRA